MNLLRQFFLKRNLYMMCCDIIKMSSKVCLTTPINFYFVQRLIQFWLQNLEVDVNKANSQYFVHNDDDLSKVRSFFFSYQH